MGPEMTPQQLEALEKLSLLLKSGAINETEFEDLKRKALSEPQTRSNETVDWDRSIFVPSNPTPLQMQVIQTGGKIWNTVLTNKKVRAVGRWLETQVSGRKGRRLLGIFIVLQIVFWGGLFLFVEPTGVTQTKPTTVMDIMNAPMPDVRCMDLQRAQDTIQARTSTFYIRSRDGSGRGRKQIVDSNWIVIGQIPAAGSSLQDINPILTVVKPGEPKDNC
jgi:hypothetical protein